MLIGILLARYLKPEGYGALNYAVGWMLIFLPIANFGLNRIIVRELVNDPEKEDVYLGTALALSLGNAVLAFGLVMFLIHLVLDEDPVSKLLIFIVSTNLILQSTNVFEPYYYAKVRLKFLSIAKIIALILSGSTKIALIIMEMPLEYFAITFSLETLVIITTLFSFYRSKEGKSVSNWKFDLKVALNYLKEGWPLILAGAFSTLNLRVDQLMIKKLLGKADTGYYSAAVKISEAYIFIGIILTETLFPAIINGKKLGQQIYHQRIQQLYDLLVWTALFFNVSIFIFAEYLIVLPFGEAYAPAVAPLRFLSFAGLFTFMALLSHKILIVEKLQHLVTVSYLVGSIFNIVFNFLLLPVLGISGAAISSIATYAIVLFYYNIVFKSCRFNLILMLNSFNIVRISKTLIRSIRKDKH